jgi:uncharacterized protein YqgC (DUF456 family)
MTTQILFLIIAGLIVAAGLIGLVLPAFPGAILIFLGFLLAAWAETRVLLENFKEITGVVKIGDRIIGEMTLQGVQSE